MNKINKTNGNMNILTPEQEQQRLQIVELEMKARYWEAQWKIRFYTLESESLQKAYDEYLTVQREKQQHMIEEMQKAINENNKKMKDEVEDQKMEDNVKQLFPTTGKVPLPTE